MEDAVAVIPGFMSRTCDHIGGCTAPGSRSSGEIAPVHFFGVYDGHGGSQFERGVACYGDWTQKGRECGGITTESDCS
ncbi:hypothetical protein glysoja_036413 [Glycine soja]|uniref:Uncharacterized protein n=1 Tax=Glycine soja TaxID=3848 RepID=A0A0B2SBI9_GLYSO|nr:hypothetical protein glysoja_036413 [Glycine soja]